jgi:hypothetical protein
MLSTPQWLRVPLAMRSMSRDAEEQEGEMVVAPGDDIVEIVARSDGGAGHQQQDRMQWIGPPGFARVIKLRKMLQKQTQTRPRNLLTQDRVSTDAHDRAPCRISTPTQS